MMDNSLAVRQGLRPQAAARIRSTGLLFARRGLDGEAERASIATNVATVYAIAGIMSGLIDFWVAGILVEDDEFRFWTKLFAPRNREDAL